MKNWFTPLNRSIMSSSLALLTFIGYTLMEMRYFLGKWIPGDGAAMVETILILLIVGGWLWALFVAAGGRRGGLVALLVFCAFTMLIGFYDFRYFPMPWPEGTMVIASFVLSVIALIALALQLRRKVH